MAWALACAVAAAAAFFGLWQRERAARARAVADAAQARADAEHHDHLDDVKRLEALVDELKKELADAELEWGANATVVAVRRRLDALLRARTGSAGDADGVPPRPAAGASQAAGPGSPRMP